MGIRLLSRTSLLWLALAARLATAQGGQTSTNGMAAGPASGAEERRYLVSLVKRIAEPVLLAGSRGELKTSLKRQAVAPGIYEKNAGLEALGRTLAGIAPWLELGPDETEEGKLRGRFIELSLAAVRNGIDPRSPDYLNFGSLTNTEDNVPIVHASYLALALLRAPTQLWGRLAPAEQAQVVTALKRTTNLKPWNNNWLLFSALIQGALWDFTGECDRKPIEIAVNACQTWYLGDGTYGDGPQFHWDYYNSYVIHPYLTAVMDICEKHNDPLKSLQKATRARALRYTAVQERMISPEGTFPVIGRSSVYRFAAFQQLSDAALRHQVPHNLKPGAIRAALTAVIRRSIEVPGTFDEEGWLRLGAVGYQASMHDFYNTVGSPYICLCGFLHLGLPASDPLWTEPASPWTQQRIWAGEDVPNDHFTE